MTDFIPISVSLAKVLDKKMQELASKPLMPANFNGKGVISHEDCKRVSEHREALKEAGK